MIADSSTVSKGVLDGEIGNGDEYYVKANNYKSANREVGYDR